MNRCDGVIIPFTKNWPMNDNSPPPPPGGFQMTCPRCASTDVEFLRRLRRLAYRMTCAWFRCEQCGHLFSQPRSVPVKGSKD
jgi:DNA-directed RNA polymerase subunit M/transcription elongation factor TFIIS